MNFGGASSDCSRYAPELEVIDHTDVLVLASLTLSISFLVIGLAIITLRDSQPLESCRHCVLFISRVLADITHMALVSPAQVLAVVPISTLVRLPPA